jgi:hypothetical protein
MRAARQDLRRGNYEVKLWQSSLGGYLDAVSLADLVDQVAHILRVPV